MTGAAAVPTASGVPHRIEADLLVTAADPPTVRDGVVVLDGRSITYAGSAAGAPATPDAVVVRCRTAMPGLWDCHVHLTGLPTLDLNALVSTPVALRAARTVDDLSAAVDAGVTSVRELGGLGTALATAVAEGSVRGPTIYAAGALLSPTAGHADLHGLPLDCVERHAHSELRLADGPSEAARAAREQLRRGAKVIKMCASGGVLSELDHPLHQQFTVAEMRAIVEVAGMAGRVVAAHCHGKAGIMAALEAGARTIEHGTFLDEEACSAMREHGAVLVPTCTAIAEVIDSGIAPAFATEKLAQVAATHTSAVSLAHAHGVMIAAGSDLMISGRTRAASWGRHGREPGLLVRAGLSPLEAILAATSRARATVGDQAALAGELRAGWDADVITLDADPLADIGVLADPDRVTGVWIHGVRVKYGDPVPLDPRSNGDPARHHAAVPTVGS